MQIIITIKEKKVQILLKEGEKEQDSLEIVEEHALSQRLLPEIDRLLKRNNLRPQDVAVMQVESDQGEAFTTTRIAKTVAQAWNFSHNYHPGGQQGWQDPGEGVKWG